MKSLEYLFVSERISGKNVLELFTVLVFCDRYMNDNFLDSIVSMKSLYSLSFVFVLKLCSKLLQFCFLFDKLLLHSP